MARLTRREKRLRNYAIGFIAITGFIASYPDLFISIMLSGIVVGIVVAVVIIGGKIKRRNQLRLSGITEIDKMEGAQFEHYLAELFKSQGYSAKVTKTSGDFGADLILQKDEKKIVVQAKRYSQNVGLEAVQEVYTAMAHYNASGGWVVTNSEFTKSAQSLAHSSGVRLINRQSLIEMSAKMKGA